MNEHKVLFVDTETGGLDPWKNSLLSVGLAVWSKGNIVDEVEIFVNDGILNVTEYALKVNGIDIDFHRENSQSLPEALMVLEEFINKNFDSNQLVTLAGHNVGFDISFLKRFYEMNNCQFHKRFSHRVIDTSSIIQFLFHSNVLKTNISSSDEAFKFFSIYVAKRHSALGDAVATAKLFNNLISLCKNQLVGY